VVTLVMVILLRVYTEVEVDVETGTEGEVSEET
jgi:hypothetical protein